MQTTASNGSNPLNRADMWQYRFDYIRKSQSFSESEKGRILRGLSKLREFFSDEWLIEATKIGRLGHPLVSYIINYAPWSQFWLVDFANRLECISNVPGVEELMERLRDPVQYGGAEPESDALYKLKTAGFDVELYPKIGTGKLKADLKASIGDSTYFFEITSLHTSLKAVRASHTFDSLSSPYSFMYHGELTISCQIHKALAEPRIKELKNKIEQAIGQVRQSKQFAYIGEPGIIDYLIVHNEISNRLDALLNKFGMKKEISGPALVVDDIRRLEAKLWDEIKQLPKNKPGVIVIYGNLTYFSGDARDFYNTIAYEVEDTIFDHDNLVMGIVIGSEAGERDAGAVVENPDYVFARTNLNNFISTSTLIVRNRYSQFAALPTNEAIVGAFTKAPKTDC